MPRIRQQYPQAYGSSGNINAEFESLIRYLNAAELGDNTLGELLAKLFDSSGNFDGPIELRKDTDGGIQYRVGEYLDESEGWVTLATLEEIRGEPGQDFGEIGAPIIFGRYDEEVSDGQTVINYAHDATDDLLVYVDGVLQQPGESNDYTNDPDANTVTFTSGRTAGELVTLYRIRATDVTGYTRADILTVDNQAVFPFVFTESTQLQVYKNGILQREGGSNDYTEQPVNNTITFNSSVPAGNLITIITVENTTVRAVTGMMFEENYADPATGLILLNKVQIPDDGIPQAKVTSLSSDLLARAIIVVSATSPTSPSTKTLWLDTSQTPNQLKFYDGTQWLRTSPESSLPTFNSANAAKFVRVNGTGTALEYADVDFSSLLKVTQRGAANGVASLDATGRLPQAQLPVVLASSSYYKTTETPAEETYAIQRIFQQKIQIVGASFQTESGSCQVQLAVNGVGLGSTYSVSATPSEFTLGSPIEVDATLASKLIGFIVSNNGSAFNLEVTLAANIIAS